ncbi:MAG: translation elongation factor Ts [Neomegalonema sp.]|nr:translation elongation factor Ts [Neomegalonema sp.]
MAQITAALVKELREKTGAGMMDAKKALTESDGDMAAAEDWLRTKLGVKADKKSSRVAAEGLVSLASDGAKAAAVEINSETDFVARNAEFQEMVAEIAKVALDLEDPADASPAGLLAAKMPSSDKPVEEHVKEKVGTIGENMTVRRMRRLAVDKGVVASYVHNAAAPGMGKIGVLVALESEGDAAKLEELGKQIAMHVAATKPAALSEADLDPALVEREKAVLTEQARESGKPDNVIEKMIVGRLNKFYQEVCLLKQAFVMDPELTVEKAVAAKAKEIGVDVKVVAFVRLEVGEGIEKEETDFAAEVAAQVSKS